MVLFSPFIFNFFPFLPACIFGYIQNCFKFVTIPKSETNWLQSRFGFLASYNEIQKNPSFFHDHLDAINDLVFDPQEQDVSDRRKYVKGFHSLRNIFLSLSA